MRGNAVFSVLNCLSFALACLFATELLVAFRPSDDPKLPVAQLQAQAKDTKTPAQLAAWRAAVLARPIFSPSRRQPALRLIRQAELPRLSGIMIMPAGRIAVFSPAGGSPIIVAENKRLGAFTVLAIAPNSVTLKGP